LLERAYTFGSSAALVGILTTPPEGTAVGGAPMVLLLNSGLIHRPGPFRMHVDLARRLVAMGFSVFRFDLSGIGDSEKHRDNRPREEQILADISEAMDFLSSNLGAKRFIAMGLCTGADNAHKISVRDERVTGAVFLDGYCYPTPLFYIRRYGAKFFNPMAWLRMARRAATKPDALADQTASRRDDREDNYFWNLPPKHQTESELKALVERGVDMLFVFTNSSEFINYPGQLRDCMKSIEFGDQLQVEYFDEFEHTYPIMKDRQCLFDVISQWMRTKYFSSNELTGPGI